MGAAASCSDVAGTVGGAGDAYKVYEQKIIDNGVDGTLIAACDVSALLDDLGVSNATHRKKIEIMANGGPVAQAVVVTPTKDAKVEAPSLLVGAAADASASATPTTSTTATTDVFISHAPNAYSTSSGATEDRAAWIAGKIRTV